MGDQNPAPATIAVADADADDDADDIRVAAAATANAVGALQDAYPADADRTPVFSNGLSSRRADDGRVSKLEAIKAALEKEMVVLRETIQKLEAQRSDLQSDLKDAHGRLALANNDLTAVSDRTCRLEGLLRVARDGLVSANEAASVSEDRVLTLQRKLEAIESGKADLQAKIVGLASKVEDFETEIDVSKAARVSAEDRARALATKAEELMAKVNVLEGRNAELEAKIGELQAVKEAFAKANSYKDSPVLWVASSVAAAAATVGLLHIRHLKQ